MNDNNLFIEGYKLPTPLPKKETMELFKKMKNGDMEAREKLAIHNIRLVLSVVDSKFSTVPYEKEDLVAIGNIGLVLAIDNYNPDKGYEFSTFAMHCICNNILMFIRKIKKQPFVDSLDRVVIEDGGKDIKLGDQISDDKVLFDDIEDAELYKIIDEIVESLPEKEREIIKIRLGFSEEKCSQYELAKRFNISQPAISRIARKTIQKIAKILEEKGIVEGYASEVAKRDAYGVEIDLNKEEAFYGIIDDLNALDFIVISLRYGYPDGICLSSEVVAKLLGIRKEEVINITRNFLLKYKDKLNIGENITRSRIKPNNK